MHHVSSHVLDMKVVLCIKPNLANIQVIPSRRKRGEDSAIYFLFRDYF